MKKMNDPIERRAALDALCDNCDNVQAVCAHFPCKQYIAVEKLPSAQPERCEDCRNFNKARLLIPQPERKKGKWIDVNGNGSLYECDQCHDRSCCAGKYCMECGAQMEVGE